MGARSSKPPPRQIEPEATAVEVSQQDPAPEAPRDNKKQKNGVPAQGGTVQAVKGKYDDAAAGNSTAASGNTQAQSGDSKEGGDKQTDANGKPKKKRKRSKKDKNQPSPPKLVRAQTQLNELKNVKPLLQQSPRSRQQHFEQIKDAYALDEEAKKAPPLDVRTRFFNFDNWRRAPSTPSGKSTTPHDVSTRESPSPLQRSQTVVVGRMFASSGRSSRASAEISNDTLIEPEDVRSDDMQVMGLDDVESISSVGRVDTRTAPIRQSDAASNQLNHNSPDVPPTQIVNQIKERRTPERSLRSQRSFHNELRLDDVDEEIMETILSDNPH